MKIKAEQIFSKEVKINNDKTNTLVKLLIEFINRGHENDIMPDKKEVSKYLGLSIGTVQNAYRILEDKGLVQSKQRIGTVITTKQFNKQSSKRDCCLKLIKEYMKKNNTKEIKALPSARKLAKELKMSLNTVCSAINLLKDGADGASKMTLVEKTEKDIEKDIMKNYKIGENIPSLNVLAEKYNVSIKTIHDAIQSLASRKILSVHRGRYGTTVINMPNKISVKKEDTIFASAKEAEFYFYEKIQANIKKLIINEYNVGDKLPSIKLLAQVMDINPNTVRHALKILEEDGYITFQRGRYGGAFVTEIPETISYKWLAVNPQYIVEYN